MKKRNKIFLLLVIPLVLLSTWILIYQHFYGLGSKNDIISDSQQVKNENFIQVKPSDKITELETGLSTVRYDQEYGFEEFLNQGGASSDQELVHYISEHILNGEVNLHMNQIPFGCSTLSVQQDESLFGRNFDWEKCNAMIVASHSPDVYASISTVNMDFITTGTSLNINQLPTHLRATIAMYAPLDGMNEQGLCVSVNMIQDSSNIQQTTDKPDLTTTTAVRLLLNRAASVDEAIALLQQYDLHASMDMMIHFAISDAFGNSVVVEYIDNQMVITKTPVVTNFYLSDGQKYGVGTAQSHERYDILMALIKNSSVQTMSDVKKALDSVSKDNFNEFESTEWSIIYNQTTGEVQYYHRENYQQGYVFHIKQEVGD